MAAPTTAAAAGAGAAPSSSPVQVAWHLETEPPLEQTGVLRHTASTLLTQPAVVAEVFDSFAIRFPAAASFRRSPVEVTTPAGWAGSESSVWSTLTVFKSLLIQVWCPCKRGRRPLSGCQQTVQPFVSFPSAARMRLPTPGLRLAPPALTCRCLRFPQLRLSSKP